MSKEFPNGIERGSGEALPIGGWPDTDVQRLSGSKHSPGKQPRLRERYYVPVGNGESQEVTREVSGRARPGTRNSQPGRAGKGGRGTDNLRMRDSVSFGFGGNGDSECLDTGASQSTSETLPGRVAAYRFPFLPEHRNPGIRTAEGCYAPRCTEVPR